MQMLRYVILPDMYNEMVSDSEPYLYASAKKGISGKCCLWPCHLNPLTLKMSSRHVNLIASNCDMFHYNTSTHSRDR